MRIGIGVMVLVCIGLILGLTEQGVAAIDLKNLTGLWMFDEGDGDESEDLSGNGNHAELIDGPEWVDGKFGKGLMFDGATSYVMIPDHENPTTAITVTAWAMSTGATWDQHGWLVEKRDAYIMHPVQGTSNMGWCISNPAPWNVPFAWDTGQVGPDDITEWHMYTGTYDSATGEWVIYIDGEKESELELDNGQIMADFGAIYVGQDT